MRRLIDVLWFFESRVLRHHPSWFCDWVWDMQIRYGAWQVFPDVDSAIEWLQQLQETR